MEHPDYGYLRVAAVTPRVHLADTSANAREIVRLCRTVRDGRRPSVIVFPELCVTGYSCADLFAQAPLLEGAQRAVEEIARETADIDALIAIGAPVPCLGRLYNCAVLLKHGRIMGLIPKEYLPGSGEFYEYRWFESGGSLAGRGQKVTFAGQQTVIDPRQLMRVGKALVAVEVCQDLWTPVPPSSYAAIAGATVILNLSASNEYLTKHEYRRSLVSATSARLTAGYVYSSCGYGESTQDLVWGGSSFICEDGSVMAENERFRTDSTVICADIDIERLDSERRRNPNFKDCNASAEAVNFTVTDCGEAADTDFGTLLLRRVDPHPFVPDGEDIDARCREILAMQVTGLMTRLEHVGCKTAVVGVSGGLDSTLALLVAVRAFDTLGWNRSRIIGVTMPGFGTTGRTRSNADILMEKLRVTRREIPVGEASAMHLKDIGHPLDVHDTTYENAQARERTQVLMDVAGETGGIVIGTGDLSELALGWCTYNGDHMSMYAVNASVPKTLVRVLVMWAARQHFADATDVLEDIVATPVSPELIPPAADGSVSQVTEDIVGPYELHDFFLYHMLRWGCQPSKVLMLACKAFGDTYSKEVIRQWLHTFCRRFFSQQFKRSCMPDGPKVGSVSLSPRGDLRMPSDASAHLWLSWAEER